MFLSDWHCYEPSLQQLPFPQLQQIPFPGLPRQVTLFNLRSKHELISRGLNVISFYFGHTIIWSNICRGLNVNFLLWSKTISYNICRGLNVSLSTDDPLQFHFTKVQKSLWLAETMSDVSGSGAVDGRVQHRSPDLQAVQQRSVWARQELGPHEWIQPWCETGGTKIYKKNPTWNILFQHWLGPNYTAEGVASNDISRTNVPDIRVAYRCEHQWL